MLDDEEAVNHSVCYLSARLVLLSLDDRTRELDFDLALLACKKLVQLRYGFKDVDFHGIIIARPFIERLAENS